MTGAAHARHLLKRTERVGIRAHRHGVTDGVENGVRKCELSGIHEPRPGLGRAPARNAQHIGTEVSRNNIRLARIVGEIASGARCKVENASGGG